MSSIHIKSTGRDEDQLLPYCPPQVYEELQRNFSLDLLLGQHHLNNDEHMGYIKGVMDVLNRVKTLSKYNNDEE